ncbi:glucocorticoid modulatory element-binding protein 1-like [Salmo salar]|uniref:Glucocorticoid modulatory element-binding protein 1-like n=1 Tax=Salmo salar TaxID=8030 RepID=A0A1S3Q1E9_SALSA|nr:glucocorticoid modulatory element-binding protein 1-like [Salmo salar]|eukprot:XP_014033279.1 PREDICTED: glucocorticoid modulatory element-binding protein 1-like [Salmo salar]
MSRNSILKEESIRMGGVMLRKMMDSGQLDFYEHSTLCTNTCRSTKFDLLINNTRFPPDGSGLTTPISSQAQVVIGNGGQVAMTTEERSDVLTRTVEWSSGAVVMETEKETSDIQCQILRKRAWSNGEELNLAELRG